MLSFFLWSNFGIQLNQVLPLFYLGNFVSVIKAKTFHVMGLCFNIYSFYIQLLNFNSF